MRYAIVIEKTENNYSAYVPDLPSCIATGATAEETEQLIREAIKLHLIGLREEGLPFQNPQVRSNTSKSRADKRATPDDGHVKLLKELNRL